MRPITKLKGAGSSLFSVNQFEILSWDFLLSTFYLWLQLAGKVVSVSKILNKYPLKLSINQAFPLFFFLLFFFHCGMLSVCIFCFKFQEEVSRAGSSREKTRVSYI